MGTRAGRRALSAARSDHWICRWRASLADRETRPAVIGSRHRQRETPTLYWLCRKAMHLCTPRHTHYISLSVATSADRRNTSTQDWLPAQLSPRHKHPETNSEPRHFKARHNMNRPQTPLSFLIPPRVSRPAPLA